MNNSNKAVGSESRPNLFYWERFTQGDIPKGTDLASLRRGIGKDAGSVPEMWQFYSQLNSEGSLTSQLEAEHVCLTLFAIHQQSQTRLVHQPGVGLGTAMRSLRVSGKFSEEAVDRRFDAAATSTSVGELAHHLRGLVSQLKSVPQTIPVDYSILCRQLSNWDRQDRQSRTRRQWGAAYFAASPKTTSNYQEANQE